MSALGQLRPAHRVFLAIGLALIATGAVVLLAAPESSSVVGSLFTIAGMILSYLQLFFAFPVLGRPGERSAATVPIPQQAFGEPATLTTAGLGLRLHALAFIGAAGSLIPAEYLALRGVTTMQQYRGAELLELIGAILLLFAYPGFYKAQAGRWPLLVGLSVAVTSCALALNALQGAVVLVAATDENPLPEAVRTLFRASLYVIVAGNVLLAVVVFARRVFPAWTGWALIAVTSTALLMMRFPDGDRSIGVAASLTNLFLFAAYVAFGARLWVLPGQAAAQDLHPQPPLSRRPDARDGA